MRKHLFFIPVLITVLGSTTVSVVSHAEPLPPDEIFAKDNLVAWCIVPFDAKRRDSTARAEMLNRLGISKMAYDWREEHVPTFEDEILACKNHGIEFFAFWSWHPEMAALIKKHGVKPQIWMTAPSPRGVTGEERVAAAARGIQPLVQETRALGCQLGLYNHGGWGGQPQNLVAVCKFLRKNHDAQHVGIVYNFHHAHDHIDDFAQSLQIIRPYLLCLNLNGMNDNAQPKIVPLGKGKHEKKMLQIVLESGYRGPIGIIDHRSDVDAEQSLRENLEGLRTLRQQIEN